MSKANLYINSKGYPVTRHSYSGSESFNFCARKYYLERVQGWSEKEQRSSREFGTALEKGVTFWHQHGEDTAGAVAEFQRRWAEFKDAPLTYTKSDLDWDRLNQTGTELVKLYALRYPTFPYVVNNPQDFQVETTFEVFPGTKLEGIEFLSYIDLLAQVKGSLESVIIDMKTAGKSVPELIALDPQLRSYAWHKKIYRVAWLWFYKRGRTISKGDTVTFLEPWAGFGPGQDAIVLSQDEFGVWVTDFADTVAEFNAISGKKKADEEARQAYLQAKGTHVPERVLTKQEVQYKEAIISQESAEDIGRSIKSDIVRIVNAKDADFYPMESGVRFPNEKCPHCAMRGICSGNNALRDTILTRKQMDELDFGKEGE